MSENATNVQPSAQPTTPPASGDEAKVETFTQADVDRIVRERVQRERAKYGDYDDLKAKAEGAKSVEQQLADLKAQNARMLRDTLAARIAARHGIAPEDADLFLTGADEETLTAQAKRLSERDAAAKKAGGVVPGEGKTPNNSGDPMRDFARQLFKKE